MKLKRKVYTSARERKVDQVRGGGLFIFVNYALLIVVSVVQGGPQTRPLSSLVVGQPAWLLLIPWFGNGIVLGLLLIFRPQMAVGYITFPALVLFAGIWLGVLFVGACLAGLVIGFPFGGSSGPVVGIVSFGLLIVGGLWSLIKGREWLDNWWSSE
jgi:hypothetical protein